MGIISNWKANRQARIEAAKAKKTVESVERRVDPRSKPFLVTVDKMLADIGLLDFNQRGQCVHALLHSSIKTMKVLSVVAGTDEEPDEALTEQVASMKKILSNYGVVNDEVQEQFILKYYEELTKAGRL